MLILLVACADPEAVSGTVVDALTGAPVAGEVVATPAKADCAVLRAEVVDGAFALPPPCRGEYAVAMADPSWTIEFEPARLRGPLALKAWPVPAADGVWLVHGGSAVALTPVARTRELTVLGKPDIVRFPDVVPDPEIVVSHGDWLVIAGGLTNPPLATLRAAAARRFGDPATPRQVPPWRYLNVDLPEDGVVQAVSTVIDTARVVAGTGRMGIADDAVAPGEYAVARGDRMVIVRFE